MSFKSWCSSCSLKIFWTRQPAAPLPALFEGIVLQMGLRAFTAPGADEVPGG